MVKSNIKLFQFLSILFIFISFFFIFPKTAKSNSVDINIELSKSFYRFDEKVSASVKLESSTETAIGPLRVVFRLTDRAGNILAYKNRYPGYLSEEPIILNYEIDSSKLTVSEGLYPCEVLIFSRGREISRKSWFVVYSESVPDLTLVPFIYLEFPFRITPQTTLKNNDFLQALNSATFEKTYLDHITADRVSAVVCPSSGFLYQLNKLKNGYILETDNKKITRPPDSPQVKLINEFLNNIKKVPESNSSVLAITPYGDLNPSLLLQHELENNLISHLNKSQQQVNNILDTNRNFSLVYLPDGGITEESLEALSNSGYSVIVKSNSSTAASFLAKNTSVLMAPQIIEDISGKSDEAAGKLLKALLQSHFQEKKERVLILPLNRIDPAAYLKFLELSKDYSFIKIKSNAPFQLKPKDDFSEQKADYGDFKELADVLLERFKESQGLLEAYKSCLVEESSKKQRLDNLLWASLFPAFNKLPDYDISFSYISKLKSTIKNDFDSIKIDTSPVSFSSKTGKLPVTIRKDTKSTLKVVLELNSKNAKINKNSIEVVLTSNEKVVTVPLEVNKTGKIPIKVQIMSPSGYLISKNTLIIRSFYFIRLISYLLLVLLILGIIIYLRFRVLRKRKQKTSGKTAS